MVELPSSEPSFLSEEPIDLLTSGRYAKVPLLTGFNAREGMLAESQSVEAYGEVRVITNFEDAVPYFLNVPNGSKKSKEIAQRIKQFYYGDEVPTLDNIDRFYIVSTTI